MMDRRALEAVSHAVRFGCHRVIGIEKDLHLRAKGVFLGARQDLQDNIGPVDGNPAIRKPSRRRQEITRSPREDIVLFQVPLPLMPPIFAFRHVARLPMTTGTSIPPETARQVRQPVVA